MTHAWNTLLHQLAATQMSAQALALQCEATMRAMQDMEQAPPPAQKPVAPEPTAGKCPHPKESRDYRARSMGHPNRFLCVACGELHEDEVTDSPTAPPQAAVFRVEE